ncbi:MAG: hypothetical protein HKP61_12665 [Dactylosporangium sp.]|nr:hypothetical protein [Dactylosporangium sp.]NNJ61771.1 hypothetical protein [Dactylosporangium sp.]
MKKVNLKTGLATCALMLGAGAFALSAGSASGDSTPAPSNAADDFIALFDTYTECAETGRMLEQRGYISYWSCYYIGVNDWKRVALYGA